jgi:hypothetical protein
MSALDRILEAAAEARSAGVAELSDRPSQRRCSEDGDSRPAAVIRAQRIELRAAEDGGSGLHFNGFASVYNRGYEMWDAWGPYMESVASGAGAASLSRSDLDVPFVLAHDSMRRIARTTNGTLTLDERAEGDSEGLWVDAPNLDPTDGDVAYIAPKLRSGLIDEMSFRFRITSGSWSPDYLSYEIREYDIHRGDVAIVGYGANPHTQGAGLRGQQVPALADLTEIALRDLENKLHAERSRRGMDTARSMKPVQFDAMSRMGIAI